MATNEQLMERYKNLLQTHDWSYEMTEDQSVWNKGHQEHKDLILLARQLDRDGSIWNSLAPAGHKLGGLP